MADLTPDDRWSPWDGDPVHPATDSFDFHPDLPEGETDG